MAKKLSAKEKAAMQAALNDIRKECGRVMRETELPEASYTKEDLELLEMLERLGY